MIFTHLRRITDGGINPSKKDTFAYFANNKLFLSKEGALRDSLSDKDFDIVNTETQGLSDKQANILKIFKEHPDKEALLITYPDNAKKLAATKQSIPPILDDMAQVVGMSLKYVSDNYEYSKALKWRNCLLLSDGGLLAIGRTVEEAVVATLVAEKAAMCYFEANKLGGAKAINKLRSALMFMVYKNKYSKENIKRQKERII